MNIEQVNALKARAEKAVSLARTHEAVVKAQKFDDLPWEVRDEALHTAKEAILQRIEMQLNQLLEPKPVVPAAQDLRIGTIDTSDEQPEPGNSWEPKAA